MGLASKLRKLSGPELALVALFVLTLPFITPRIDWDGVGYYAYARSLIFDHNLRFKGDWKNVSGQQLVVAPSTNGVPQGMYVTKTGHMSNYLAVGPAILWTPFVAGTHAAILVRHGGKDPYGADGHGLAYVRAVCFGSAFYAFLGLWISFRLARRFVEEKWALLATVAIWLASSLTVYMYSDPSWAHADCVFVVALFLWCWILARDAETLRRWAVWGAAAGLMCDVYFPHTVFLLLPVLELALDSRNGEDRIGAMKASLSRALAFAGAFIIGFLPTLIVRQIIFGNPLSTGAYGSKPWHWTSPKLWSVLFSPNHGAFTTTPILILAVAGLFFLWPRQPRVAGGLILLALALWCLIAVYPWWDGVLSFGSRFFISLTPVFVVGLAVAFERFASIWHDSRAAMRRAAVVSALLIVWNLGLIYQLDHGLFPQIAPIDWQNAVYNQFRTVPGMVVQQISARFSPRRNADSPEQARSN